MKAEKYADGTLTYFNEEQRSVAVNAKTLLGDRFIGIAPGQKLIVYTNGAYTLTTGDYMGEMKLTYKVGDWVVLRPKEADHRDNWDVWEPWCGLPCEVIGLRSYDDNYIKVMPLTPGPDGTNSISWAVDAMEPYQS